MARRLGAVHRRFPSVYLAYTWPPPIEYLSSTYPTPIRQLSDIYPTNGKCLELRHMLGRRKKEECRMKK
jgi:hypothetical protein